MLTLHLTFTLCLLGALFPLFLWIVDREQREVNIHRFVLGLALSAAAGGILLTLSLELERTLMAVGFSWLISLFAVTLFFWRRRRAESWVVTIPSLLGSVFIARITGHLITGDLISILVLILDGLILSGSLFAMILGHWYLNVVNLPISLLRSAPRSILVFLSLRAVWNVFALFSQSVSISGFEMPLTEFLWTLEGIFLWCAIFFGTLLPLALSFLTLRTVAIHSTQSATGLLYVLVVSVIMGDLFYRFYSIQYALFL